MNDDATTTPNAEASREDRLALQVYALQMQAEVDTALIAHLEGEGVIAKAEIATLSGALSEAIATARRIGTAIGYIMALESVTDAEAFDTLKRTSAKANRRLLDVAEETLAE